jgi:hypothetical protein
MKKTRQITITTFWLDWLLFPLVLVAAWLTLQWALSDMNQASNLETWGTMPNWMVSTPLLITAASWVIIGLGMLIREEYWEFQMIRSGVIGWSICGFIGAGLIVLGYMQVNNNLGVSGILNLIGLLLMSLLTVVPAWIDHSSTDKVIRSARVWFILLAIGVGCLMAGMMFGFPYNFTRFPLVIGAFLFFGLGLTEITFRKTSFPWLLRLFQFNIGGREYHDQFPESTAWRIIGFVKVLVGVAIVAMLAIISFT